MRWKTGPKKKTQNRHEHKSLVAFVVCMLRIKSLISRFPLNFHGHALGSVDIAYGCRWFFFRTTSQLSGSRILMDRYNSTPCKTSIKNWTREILCKHHATLDLWTIAHWRAQCPRCLWSIILRWACVYWTSFNSAMQDDRVQPDRSRSIDEVLKLSHHKSIRGHLGTPYKPTIWILDN